MHDHITCMNCGHQFQGKFCNQCGEKVYSDHDKTFKHFIEESFHFITHFDSKLLKTWWLIMTRPAKVSRDIVAGIRKPYYKPVNLFLIGVILYLLFPAFPGLNMPLRNHFNELHGQWAKTMVRTKMENKHLTIEQVAHKFDEKSPKFAKILLLITIPLGGLALQLLFWKKRRYYFDHLTLSSELSTFYLFYTCFIVPTAFDIVILIAGLFGGSRLDFGDAIALPSYLVVFGTYVSFALHRFYDAKWGWAILKSVLFLIAHGFIVYILYRFIIFCVVLLFI